MIRKSSTNAARNATTKCEKAFCAKHHNLINTMKLKSSIEINQIKICNALLSQPLDVHVNNDLFNLKVHLTGINDIFSFDHNLIWN